MSVRHPAVVHQKIATVPAVALDRETMIEGTIIPGQETEMKEVAKKEGNHTWILPSDTAL